MIYCIYMQPKKQLKVQYIIQNRLFLLTKNALLKRGPKNSGIGRPPPSPLTRAMPERKRFFSIGPFPNLKSVLLH